MKLEARSIGRLDSPGPDVRFYLFHGYDPGQSKAMAERLLKGLGAEKSPIASGGLKSDPALLAAEAGAIGLFGERRALWIEPAGEEIGDAVEALLAAPAAESPVIALAGPLKKSSKLLQIAEAATAALSLQVRELNHGDLERVVEDLARSEGLQLRPGIAARIAAAAGGDRGIIAQEVFKIATYAGATPEVPAIADHEMLEAIGTATEGESARLGTLALSGDIRGLAGELSKQPITEAISLIRALQRRLSMLSPLRAQVDGGRSPHDVVASAGKSVFFKEKDAVISMLSAWDSPRLARLAERLGDLERDFMRTETRPPEEAIAEELIAIARSARRR